MRGLVGARGGAWGGTGAVRAHWHPSWRPGPSDTFSAWTVCVVQRRNAQCGQLTADSRSRARIWQGSNLTGSNKCPNGVRSFEKSRLPSRVLHVPGTLRISPVVHVTATLSPPARLSAADREAGAPTAARLALRWKRGLHSWERLSKYSLRSRAGMRN